MEILRALCVYFLGLDSVECPLKWCWMQSVYHGMVVKVGVLWMSGVDNLVSSKSLQTTDNYSWSGESRFQVWSTEVTESEWWRIQQRKTADRDRVGKIE